MGKKVKKKAARSVHKEKQPSTLSAKTVAYPQQSIPSTAAVDDVINERKLCSHLDEIIDLAKVSSRLESQEHIRCEDCREVVVDRRSSSKGKGKHGKKKGGGSGDTKSRSKATWACLECGHISCGGIGLPDTPQSHAVRHARQTRHPCAIQFENPQLRWCFQCKTLIPVETLEENGEKRDLLLDIVKLIKGQSSRGPSEDVEDGWSANGIVANGIKLDNTASASFDGKDDYVVRGLVNLGNTCFFNSIMQNLLAMDRLRDYFLELDESVGPLTVSLKKFFTEAGSESGLKNAINPRSFFGCLCAKAPQFRGYQQHDSHELLRCLLDGLCTEELSARKRTIALENGNSKTLSPTFVDAAFGGQLSSTVACLECGHSSTVFEPFLDLSLPVPTKKPPSKRAPPLPRAKKPKLPPKRSGRSRPKTNRDADSASEKVGDSLVGSKMVEPTGLPIVEDKKSLVSSSLSTAEDLEQKPFRDEESVDNLPWLDYVESVPASNDQDIASKPDDLAKINDSGQKDAVQGEASLKETSTADALGNLSWLDYLEPGILPDENDNDMGSNVDDVSLVQDSGTKDSLANDIFLHEELPLQVQVSEDLVFPQKEEASISGEILRGEGEVSSSAVGYEPDTSDFDGFGGLFNEPEVEGPNLKSSSTDTNIHANEIAETGFLVSNISESDPDEVDNRDSPVSIESCLALFTKPELLSDEHAWHCENCSKAVQKKRMQSRKSQQNGTSEIQMRVADKITQTAPSNSTNEGPSPIDGDIREAVFSTSNEAVVPENGKINDNQNDKKEISEEAGLILSIPRLKEGSSDMNDACPVLSESSSSYKTCTQASICGEASDSCTVNDPSNAGSETGEVQQMKLELVPKGSESEGSDNEINSDSVKVKRDATKRILINRAPPILTMHLKRFSQDARGRLSKLNGHVVFRETIDLRPYLDPRCMEADGYKFRLIGVVEHQGTMRGGHYVAYVRAAKGNKKADKESTDFVWYHASDAQVRKASLEQVLKCEAYILFYEQL